MKKRERERERDDTIHPASADTSEGWNWIFGDLETFLTFFFIFGSKVNFPMDENRLSHNDLTRRIDPRAPEAPWIFF